MKTASCPLVLACVLAALTPSAASAAPCMQNSQCLQAAAAAKTNALSAGERAGLLLMREEEKLAHDVYQALYAHWQLPAFANISRSEAQHMQAMQTLLTRYGLADPVSNHPPGVFTNPQLQALYQQLVSEGKQSVQAALKVGAQIEDLDIADLERLTAQTDKADIRRVYGQLNRGSRNHLRSFTRLLRHYGADYQAQHISAAQYRQIIATPMERGNNRGSNQIESPSRN